jgi:hypothetical protein
VSELPFQKIKGGHAMNTPLLCKPLKDHLNGLLNKVDVYSDRKVIQNITDCALFLLIELQRIDQGVSNDTLY